MHTCFRTASAGTSGGPPATWRGVQPGCIGFRVQGLQCRGLGFRIQDLGLMVQDLGFRVQGLR